MGRQSTAPSSLIALLQERFRELQRAKERRELMQQFSKPTRPAGGVIPTTDPQPDLGLEAPAIAVRLSLRLISRRNPVNRPKAVGMKGTEPRTGFRARSGGGAAALAKGFENHSDVDTTLYL